MRLTPNRQKNRTPPRGPRIAIEMDEITAELHYRGGEPRGAGAHSPARTGRR